MSTTHEARQPHSQHGLSLKTQHVLIGLLIFRLINALCTNQTFFQPDEYFQALEPAWNLAFGPRSGAWLTWVSILRFLIGKYNRLTRQSRNGNTICVPRSIRHCSLLRSPWWIRSRPFCHGRHISELPSWPSCPVWYKHALPCWAISTPGSSQKRSMAQAVGQPGLRYVRDTRAVDVGGLLLTIRAAMCDDA